jgi:radical SAM protein with 4Fe4S-binding SPASM domain
MEIQTYSEFSARIHSQVNPKRIPVNGTIELTNRCPLTCAHCYNNLPMNDRAARFGEMSLEEHKTLLDQLEQAGCLWLLYSGGEIFARRDFFEIYEHAKRRGFLITLFTNGILIDERVADRLAAMPPFSIEITLYGATAPTYEALTGIPGSYEKCMRGIHLLLERKLPLKLKTVAISINHHEVFAMKELAEELGVEFKFDAMINPRIDCSNSPLAVRLTPEEIVSLDLRDGERVAEWRRLAEEFAPDLPAPGVTQLLYDCGAGVNSWAVDPYGNLTMCVLSHMDRFNLRGRTFNEGWEFLTTQVRRKSITRPTKCNTCSLKSLCGMCPANGELENGDPEAPVEYLCRVAHLRAEAFGVYVRPHGDCENCADHEELVRIAADLHARVDDEPMMRPIPEAAAGGCATGGCSSCRK